MSNDPCKQAAMHLLDVQFESFLTRIESVDVDLRAAFFSGVSAGMDLCNTIKLSSTDDGL